MRGKKHPDDVRAKVTAALLAGASVTEVSEELNLPHQTVSRFRSEIPEGKLSELGRKKGERLDDLVYQCLVRNLQTLDKTAETVSDADYIRKQPAGELATLYGVMADKTIRLLAATTNPGNLPRQLEPATA